ncbi:hypothetical protein [Saccharopolyspora griseoalba]|uniref:Uncharacterized protein n=1 Tax=Saccharopolyspora griseoalba TaxID=1431848 RepID=A0ABW2LWA2_9PSEU
MTAPQHPWNRPTPDPVPTVAAPPPGPQHPDPLAALLEFDTAGFDVTANYLVIPAGLTHAMPPAWRQQLATLLAELRAAHRHRRWPSYRVTAVNHVPLNELSLGQLDEAGIIADPTEDGGLRYSPRHQPDRTLDPTTRVHVTCPDPLQPPPRSH